MASITVRPVSGALGAEIGDVDLGNLNEETFAEVRQAFLDHQVIFFREQTISPEQQVAFAKRFGGIHFHPYMKGMDAHPEILEIIKEPGDSYTFGAAWHTDQMFNPEPAMATMLYAHESPSVGGDTMFSSMYKAHDGLSEAMRNLLKTVRTFNVGDRFKQMSGGSSRADRYKGNAKMASSIRDPGNVVTEAHHPLFRTHPETGKAALYIGSHTQGLEGMRAEEADPIIDYLRKHSIRPEYLCRFRWEPGSIALWDNRCVQHYAVPDYNERRRMHRITIAGDAPY
ncbi:MAG: TauD/TfdA dioxygenase family protein [Alphaproteobacteria bacterium]